MTPPETKTPHCADNPDEDLALAAAFFEAGFAAGQAIALLQQRYPQVDRDLVGKMLTQSRPHMSGGTVDNGGKVVSSSGGGGTESPGEPVIPEKHPPRTSHGGKTGSGGKIVASSDGGKTRSPGKPAARPSHGVSSPLGLVPSTRVEERIEERRERRGAGAKGYGQGGAQGGTADTGGRVQTGGG